MIHELSREAFSRVACFFEGLRPLVFAVLDGTYAGRVWADRPEESSAAMVGSSLGYDVGGGPDTRFAHEVRRLLREGTLLGEAACPARSMARFVGHGVEAREAIEHVLREWEPIRGRFLCYRRETTRAAPGVSSPAGYRVRPLDRALLESSELDGVADLRRKVARSAGSVAAFLEREVGAVAIHAGRVVGHVHSVYAGAGGCEVGAFVGAEHRGRGLAGWLVEECTRQARAHDIPSMDWHCLETNAASIRVAEKAGFRRVGDYAFRDVYSDPAMHLVMAGHRHDETGETKEALRCFERAVETEGCPPFGLARAAAAHARLGHVEEALRLLHAAIDRGYRSRTALLTNEHHAALRGLDGFDAALARMPVA